MTRAARRHDAPEPWQPPGPISAAFCDAPEPVTCLMGPAGGGKTTTSLQRGVMLALAWPETRPSLRRVRFGVVRRLMTDIERTTIPSWTTWFPRSMGTWRGARNEPQAHELRFAHPNGGIVELEVVFRGIGDQDIDQALRGWEVSFAYVDECDTLAPGAMGWLYTRMGRYPSETLDRNPKQLWGSCNAPELGNWVLEDFIDAPRPGWKLYRQPSGLSPQAENLTKLGANWYHEQAKTLPPYIRKRMIENIPGLSPELDAVYPEFNPDLHVATAPIDVLPGRPVLLGLDAGGTPAAAFCQVAANGQRRIVHELSTHAKDGGSITGPSRFGEAVARVLAERFAGLPIRALADPSAQWGADSVNGEGSWIDIVARTAGIPVLPAPTNDPTIRLEALRWPMQQMIDGRHPGLLVCPSCVLTLRGLARDYRFATTGGRRSDKPLKNWASHLIEAAQYALLDGGAFHEVTARQQQRRDGARPRQADIRFNPFARR